jgi:hypothetical protein
MRPRKQDQIGFVIDLEIYWLGVDPLDSDSGVLLFCLSVMLALPLTFLAGS